VQLSIQNTRNIASRAFGLLLHTRPFRKPSPYHQKLMGYIAFDRNSWHKQAALAHLGERQTEVHFMSFLASAKSILEALCSIHRSGIIDVLFCWTCLCGVFLLVMG
jgi:hypothetical protein